MSPTITHVIAITALIFVLIALQIYTYSNVNLMNTENFRRILKTIADNYALIVKELYTAGYNNTITRVNNPVEIASGVYYNVYIGYGVYLKNLFPEIAHDPRYNDYNVYVVAALPDRTVCAYSLAIPGESVREVLIARGSVKYPFTGVGFPPSKGYTEQGLQWVCRMPINITGHPSIEVTNYLVLVELDLNRINCTYQGRVFKPTRDDVRFADSDGRTRLRYWIEYWNETSGKARIWVEIPSIPAGSTKHIFMYWGQPLAREASDSSIFPLFTDLSQYRDIRELLTGGDWHALAVFANYSLYPYTLDQNGVKGAKLDVNYTLPNPSLEAYLSIFTLRNFHPSTQGWIAEALGAPLTSNDHDFRLEWYNVSAETLPLRFRLIGIYEDFSITNDTSVLDNYWIVWGQWDIVTKNLSGTVTTILEGNNTDNPRKNLENYYVAAIMRENIEYQSPSQGQALGHEYATFIAKIYLEPDNIVRGIVLASDWRINISGTKNLGIGVRETPNGSIVLEAVVFPDIDTDRWFLDNTLLPEPYSGWIYLVVSARLPGTATPEISAYVYDENFTLLLSFSEESEKFQSIPQDPDYIGFYSYSDKNLILPPADYIKPSYFQQLVSTRYDTAYVSDLTGSETIDITKIYIRGLPAGWSITIYDSGLNKLFSAVSEFIDPNTAETLAVINVSDTPILGLNGTLYIEIRDQYDNLVYYFADEDLVLYGGSIIEFDFGIGSPSDRVVTGINAANTGGQGFEWIRVINTGEKLETVSLAPATTGEPVIVGVGLFDNISYFFIKSIDYSTIIEETVAFPTSGYYRLVFGTSKLNTGKEVFTSAFYSWIRVRPFVYPEPGAVPWYEMIETIAVRKPPIIEYTLVGDYVVFSSTLLVDLALVVDSNGNRVIVAVFNGVRAP
ncbi:MAG: DUF2341 domain-containing protein [Thermoprotei archaeon]